jgi:hypothetical protein
MPPLGLPRLTPYPTPILCSEAALPKRASRAALFLYGAEGFSKFIVKESQFP